MALNSNQVLQWVIAWSKDGVIEGYLSNPEFIFPNIGMALENKALAASILMPMFPHIQMSQLHIVPLKEMT